MNRIASEPQASHTTRPNHSGASAPRPDLRLEELEQWLQLVDALAVKVSHAGSMDSEKWTFGRVTSHPAGEAEKR
jgi:hypothetical protein